MRKMQTKMEIVADTVTAYLSGEIDHHNAPQIRETIDEYIISRKPKKLVIDFKDVSFMDSSGIGLVMGRYRLIENMNCKLAVVNLSPHAYKVMQLAGMEKIAILKKKQREVPKNEIA